MSEHPEIWLEPEPPADCEWGRQWCQHNVWGERAAHYVLAAAPAPTVSGVPDWKRAFAAQSRKLQAVLHLPGVKEELASLDWSEGDDPAPTRAEVLERHIRQMLGAIEAGSIDSEEIGTDDVLPHKWHEEWAHHVRRALGEKP